MSKQICVENIGDYSIETIDECLILTPIPHYIDEETLKDNVTGSKPNQYKIVDKYGNVISEKQKSYHHILIDIWANKPLKYLFKNSSFNFKLSDENGTNGFRWAEVLQMSVQGQQAKNSIDEILKMSIINEFRVDISIKLKDSQIIWYKSY